VDVPLLCDPANIPEKVHFPEVHAIVAKDRVDHRQVEIDVRHDDLQEIVFPAERLARRPRQSDPPLAGTGELCFRDRAGEDDGLADSRAEFLEALLVVGCLGGASPANQPAPALT
jgi:hypothetical protein